MASGSRLLDEAANHDDLATGRLQDPFNLPIISNHVFFRSFIHVIRILQFYIPVLFSFKKLPLGPCLVGEALRPWGL